ncbi:MAG: hypothetical protein DRO12_02780 [Thermoprotei archaeon]|nr:MAG: hypothetical protein DRO12_02780 [Thermoprotei archaeon]
MRIGRLLRVFMWKELTDLGRDYTTLIMAVLLPLILMPVTAAATLGLREQQIAPTIYVEVEDIAGNYTLCPGVVLDLENVVDALVNEMMLRGAVLARDYREADLWLRLPIGFMQNLSSLHAQAVVYVELIPGSSRSQQAFNIVMEALGAISAEVSQAKISCLGNVSREALCNPVLVVYSYKIPGLGEVPFEEAARYSAAKLLMFSLMFVLSPVTLYLVDSIVGERERRTLEALMSLPIAKYSFVLGKVISSSVLGGVAAVSDAAGLLIYFYLLGGAALKLDPFIVVMHGVAVYVTALLCLALALPIVLRSPTYRSANIASLGVIGAASVVYMAALFVDLHALSPLGTLLVHLDPFTYTALFIHYVVFGNYSQGLTYIVAALGISLALIGLSTYMLNYEKLVYTVRE